MKSIFLLFSLLLIPISAFSQTLHHQMISAQGGKSSLESGILVNYTVGQQSVVGTKTGNITVQQGFQQSNWNKIIAQNNVSVSTSTFPNPFLDRINFSFTASVGETISLHIYDVSGRLVFTDNLQVVELTTSIDLKHLPSANYFIQLSSLNYLYYTKIIKN
jgi:hypothetical protein